MLDMQPRCGVFMSVVLLTPEQRWQSASYLFLARVTGHQYLPSASCEHAATVLYKFAPIAAWKGAGSELNSLKLEAAPGSAILDVGCYCLVIKEKPDSVPTGASAEQAFDYYPMPPTGSPPPALARAAEDARNFERISDSLGGPKVGTSLVRDLAPLLKDSAETNRIGAALLLGEVALAPKAADAELSAALLRAGSDWEQRALVEALVRLALHAGSPTTGLFGALQAKSPQARSVALQQCAALGPAGEPLIRVVVLLAGDPSPIVRQDALNLLPIIDASGADAKAALSKATTDPDPDVSRLAKRKLAEWSFAGGERAAHQLPALQLWPEPAGAVPGGRWSGHIHSSRDSCDWRREVEGLALTMPDTGWLAEYAGRASRESGYRGALEVGLRDPNLRLAVNCARILQRVPRYLGDLATTYLRALGDSPMGLLAAFELKSMGKFVKSADSVIVLNARKALETPRPAKGLEQRNPSYSKIAAVSLLSSPDPAVVSRSLAVILENKAASDVPLEFLLPLLRSPDLGVQTQAVQVVGELGPRATRALPILNRIRDHDGRDWMKQLAGEAIEKIQGVRDSAATH